eukprot:s737_g37.t2
MPLRLVVFDFVRDSGKAICDRLQTAATLPEPLWFDADQTLSVVHVYNSIAGGREVWQLPAPHACSEAGQLARIVSLDRHPQLQQQGGFAMAAFGGAERVQRLAGMLEQLRQAGVECIICSRGLVGPIQKLLDQLGLLRYFSEVYGNIGDAYGQMRHVDGVKCDRALLEAAERVASNGPICLVDAMDLWDKAKDGSRITEVERHTLGWVLEHLEFTEKGRAFMEQQLLDGSYYTSIGRTKYSRKLLQRAEAFSAEQSISQQQAVDLWQSALDGERLGDCERRTLRYVLQNLNATTGARKFLLAKLDPAVTPDESQLPRSKSLTSSSSAVRSRGAPILSAEWILSFVGSLAKTGEEPLYRTIDGVKYDRLLLEKAESAAARNSGQLSLADVAAIWDDASDGSLTALEKETLSYVLEHFNVSQKASRYLESKLHPRKPGGFFKTVDRVKCDRELLEKAQGFADEGNISEEQAMELWADAIDGGPIIDCEVRSLQYILENLSVTVGAETYLRSELKAAAADEVADAPDVVSPNFSTPPAASGASPRASASRRSAASTVPETASEPATPKAKAKATPLSPKASPKATPKAAAKAAAKAAVSPKVSSPAPSAAVSVASVASPKATPKAATPKASTPKAATPKAKPKSPAPKAATSKAPTPKAPETASSPTAPKTIASPAPKATASSPAPSPAPTAATPAASPAPTPAPTPAASSAASPAPKATPEARPASPEAPIRRIREKSPPAPTAPPQPSPSREPTPKAASAKKVQPQAEPAQKAQSPAKEQDPLGACLQREQSASMALEKAKAAEQRLPALEQEIVKLQNSFDRATAAADKARAAAQSAQTAAERAGKEQHILEQTLQAKKQEAEEAAKEVQRKTELEKALAEAKLQREKAEDAEKAKTATPKAAAKDPAIGFPEATEADSKAGDNADPTMAKKWLCEHASRPAGVNRYDSQVRRSNLGDDVKYLGTRQQSEWGSKRDVMEKSILSRGIRPDEAIFVDDQSHEIKAMHGACRTLQVYPPCGIEQPHMNELLRHAPRRSMGTPGASPGFVSPTGVAPALERRPSRGSGRWPAAGSAPEARPQQESFLAYAKPTTAGSGPGRRDAPKGKWLPSISNGRQEKTNRLLRSIWCCQS